MSLSLRSSRAIGAFLAFYSVAPVASAAEPDAAQIDQIVVTATRAPTPRSSVGDSVTVIDAEAARMSQKTAVSDLLTTTPGISASRNGGLGTTTSLRIRGAEADQTVVLIDGVKLNDPSSTGGGYNFANLLVSDIARIEVLRGSQSTLWGSQAIGGVVNIVTPEPSGPLSTTFDVQGGSYGTMAVTARAQAGGDRFAWRLGGNYLTTDGISAFDEDLGGREEDGYRNVGFNARGIVRITDAISAELRSTWSHGRAEIDGFPPPTFALADTSEYAKTDESVSYAGLKVDTLDARFQHRVGIAYTDTDRENIDPRSSVPQTFDASGTNLRYEYQGTLTLSDRVQGVFGAERERSELSSASPTVANPTPSPLRRDVTLDSVYAQVQVTPISAMTLSGGVRYDDHETFGGHTSGKVAVAWSATGSTIVRASRGEGFKAPTLFQLYSQFGTPTLDPEESSDWEAGVEQRLFDRLSVSATYFNRETDDLIDFVSCSGVRSPRCTAQPGGYYENVQRASTEGYEIGLTAQIVERVRFDANYTGLDARNESRGTANFGKHLARRPNDSANAQLTIGWRIPLTTTLAAQYVGKRFDTAANTFVLEDYTLVDLRAAYRFSQSLEVYGRIENAFDEDYSTVRRYGSVGRGYYIGMRVTL